MPKGIYKHKSLSEEHKRKIGDANRGNHPKTEFKKGHINPDEWRKMMSKKIKGRVSPMKGRHHTEETKKRISLGGKGRIVSEETRKKMRNYNLSISKELSERMKKVRMNQVFPFVDSSIEVKIQNFLKQLKIEFFTHQYMNIIHAYQCDIFIPIQQGIIQPIIIECDGDWYHGNKNVHPNLKDWQIERIKRDQLRTSELIEKGFRVLRLWEHEINDMDIEIFKDRMELR